MMIEQKRWARRRHMVVSTVAFLLGAALVASPGYGGAKTAKKATKSRTTIKAAVVTTSIAPPTSKVLSPPDSGAADNALFFAAARATEADSINSTFRIVGNPLTDADVADYRNAQAKLKACDGFPEAMPFYTAKAKAAQGWLYNSPAGGSRFPYSSHVVVLFSDEATAHGVLESVRNHAATPTCHADFNAEIVRTQQDFVVANTNARFGSALGVLGDDQMSILFDSARIVDGVAELASAREIRVVRVGAALLIYRDEPASADRITPILAAKLLAARSLMRRAGDSSVGGGSRDRRSGGPYRSG